METLERQDDLSSIVLSPFLIEPLIFPQVVKEFSSIQEVNDEVESLRCLECVVELHNEGVVESL